MSVSAEVLAAFFAWVERQGVFSVALHVPEDAPAGRGTAIVEWAIRRDPPRLAFAGAWTGARKIDVVSARPVGDTWVTVSGSNGYTFTLAPLEWPPHLAVVAEWREQATPELREHVRCMVRDLANPPPPPPAPVKRFRAMWFAARGYRIEDGWEYLGVVLHHGDAVTFHPLPGREATAKARGLEEGVVFEPPTGRTVDDAWDYLQERGLGLYTAFTDPVEVEGTEDAVLSALLNAPPG